MVPSITNEPTISGRALEGEMTYPPSEGRLNWMVSDPARALASSTAARNVQRPLDATAHTRSPGAVSASSPVEFTVKVASAKTLDGDKLGR